MNPTEIEFAVRDLVAKPYDPAAFPLDLIGIYNAPKTTVSKLKNGQTNMATKPGDVLWKKHLFFRSVGSNDDVSATADALVADPLTTKHKPRFVFVTNGETVHVRDLTLDDTANVEYAQLDEKSDFLLPLAGYERRGAIEEHPADIKAAKRLKKLYDAILVGNPTWSTGHHTHELNLFMTRVLFCLYAEDTAIFDVPQMFTNTLAQYTKEDGCDVAPFLDRLFRIMNIEEAKRPKATPAVETKFPYVNGSLFEATLEIPTFNRTARRLLLECGELDWTTINPDIFGSMIQTIAQDGTRSDLGMHYTSVPNIMKVLRPLFLDDLDDAYERAKDSVPKLEVLLGRLAKVRVFDPACGSGNFLIIAYKELRQIEIRVLNRIGDISPKSPLRLSGIAIQNFYGIDLVDFACETAKLSLWIAEHQMNLLFRDIFGSARPTLPLGKISTIHWSNALRLEWSDICPLDDTAETFICGNPPYAGSNNQTADQKQDIAALFEPLVRNYKNIDYVACFFLKVATYLSAGFAKSAFVSTNSICQGEQVPILWPLIYSCKVDISFAYPSFKWQNSASNNAFVYCIIIGLSCSNSKGQKALYSGDHKIFVQEIGPYLTPATTLVVEKAPKPLNGLTEMMYGSKPTDGGHLILSPDEHTHIASAYPAAAAFMRRYYGSEDFINGIERWCLWIEEAEASVALSIEPIRRRVEEVKKFRLGSRKSATVGSARRPYAFMEARHQDRVDSALIVPCIFSERRTYQTIGLLSARDVVSNKAFTIYGPPGYLFSVLSSLMHAVWTKAICGRSGMVINYSNTLIYNNFPIPTLSEEQRRILSEHSKAILKSRARHPGKSIAWLYNPETMPPDLLQSHQQNDAHLEEQIYGRKFKDDMHRLEHMFSMYARMKEKNEIQDTLFAKPYKKAV